MSLVFKVFVTRRSLVGHVGDSDTSMCRHICISSSVVSGLFKKKYVTGSSWNLVSFMPCHVGEIGCYTHLTWFQFFRLNNNVILCAFRFITGPFTHFVVTN
jgi:hypothetical protein